MVLELCMVNAGESFLETKRQSSVPHDHITTWDLVSDPKTKTSKQRESQGMENPTGNGGKRIKKPMSALGKLQGMGERIQNIGATKEEET